MNNKANSTSFKKGNVPKHPFKKGHVAWNMGTKGIMKASETSFEKGHVPANKGIFNSEETDAIHSWIKQKLGQPKYCELCKKTDKKQYDWANKDHLYKRNIKDWMRLCRGCHMKFDYKFNSRRKANANKI